MSSMSLISARERELHEGGSARGEVWLVGQNAYPQTEISSGDGCFASYKSGRFVPSKLVYIIVLCDSSLSITV